MKLRKNGQSFIATLPISTVRSLGWKEGDEIDLNREGRRIIISKVGDG